MVPCVLAMEPRYTGAVASGDQEDWVRGLARVFTETAEAYTDLLLAPTEATPLGVPLVRLVLVCTANQDQAIAEMTLRFWYFFVKRWHDLQTFDDATQLWTSQDELKDAMRQK
jgi:hypothetical protein